MRNTMWAMLALAPALLASSEHPVESRIRQIDDMLSQRYPAQEPGAAVIVVKDGAVLFRRAYGIADLEQGVAMTPEMAFPVGSLSKQFTAAAVMLLVEDGLLSLDDAIEQYYPGCPEDWRMVRIRHLLSHTSGIKNYNEIPSWRKRIREEITPEELIGLFRAEPLDFEPGEQWKYSNSGYTLLAAIIETVTGQPFREFVSERIFRKLKMGRTFYSDHDRIIPGRVRGYRKDKGRILNARFMSMSHTYGGGDVITTVDDLATWTRAFYSGQLLSASSLEMCLTPTELAGSRKAGYGFGWFIGEIEGRKTLSHGGGIFGFVNHTLYMPDERLYVALLANLVDPQAAPPTYAVAQSVASAFLDAAGDVPETQATPLGKGELAKYAGVYRIGGRQTRRVVVEQGRLWYEVAPGRKVEIVSESQAKFVARGKSAYLMFDFDDNGAVTGFVIHQSSGMSVEAVKE